MGKKHELLVLIIGFIFAAGWCGFHLTHPTKAPPSPEVSLTDSLGTFVPFDYAAQKALYENNIATYQAAINTSCGPAFDTSCLLRDTLDKLKAHGTSDDKSFAALLKLAETINFYDDVALQTDLLGVLQGQTARLWNKDVKLRLAIMETYYAMGDMQNGDNILRTFKDSKTAYDYIDFPPAHAINTLTFHGRLDDAVRVVNETRSWDIKVNDPPQGCFSPNGNKGMSVNTLVQQLIVHNNFVPLAAMIDAAWDKSSIFYSYYDAYNPILDIIEHLYSNSPFAPKPPAGLGICEEISKVGDMRGDITARDLVKLGCVQEAKTLSDQALRGHAKAWERPNYFAIAGQDAEAFNAVAQAGNYEQVFNSTIKLAEIYSDLGNVAARDRAVDVVRTMAEPAVKQHAASEVDTIANYYWLLKRTGKDDERKALQKRLLDYAKKSGDLRAYTILVYFMDHADPGYPSVANGSDEADRERNAIAEEESKNSASPKATYIPTKVHDYAVERAARLIEEGKIDQARKVYEAAPPLPKNIADPFSDPVMEALILTHAAKGPWFEELWTNRMSRCVKNSIDPRLANEPTLLAATCSTAFIDGTLRKNYYRIYDKFPTNQSISTHIHGSNL